MLLREGVADKGVGVGAGVVVRGAGQRLLRRWASADELERREWRVCVDKSE